MLKLTTFLTCLVSLVSNSVYASHLFGGEISYKNMGGLTYEIKLTFYGDCSGQSYQNLFSSTPHIKIYNGNNAFADITLQAVGVPGEEVTPVCPDFINSTTCKGGNIPGVARFIFATTVTLNAYSQDWLFVFNGDMGASQAGRSLSITNITPNGNNSTLLSLRATLNNLTAPNNSSTYTTIPTPFFCINNAQQYNQGAIDSDGDNMQFELVEAINGSTGSAVNYLGAFTYDNPLAYVPGTFNFSTGNGQLDFTPNAVQNAVVVTKVTEKRNGVIVGTTMREMVFVVLNNCNNQSPNASINPNHNGISNTAQEITLCNAQNNLNFSIKTYDPDSGIVTVSYSGLPQGATVNVLNNNSKNPIVNFNWNIPNNLNYGDYTFYLTLQDDNCPLSSKQTIAFTIHYIQPITYIATATAESCVPANDGSIILNASSQYGGISYSINGGAFQKNDTLKQLTKGNYTIKIIDTFGCYLDVNTEVPKSPDPVFDSIHVKNIQCYGQTNGYIQVYSSATGASYQMMPGNIISNTGIFDMLTQNIYTITITDNKGCTANTSAAIIEPEPIHFTNVEITETTCNKNNGIIKATSNFPDNTWYQLIPTTLPLNTHGVFAELSAGTYTLEIINSNLCKIDTVLTVPEKPNDFKSYITHKDLPCIGKGTEGEANINISGGVMPYTVLWSTSPPSTDFSITHLTYGYYFADITDAQGCAIRDTVYIQPGTCCEEIFFPNAFTPNNDGLNDNWHFITSTGMEIVQYAIYDRWGQKIWFARDQNAVWDGTINGKDCTIGTYYFILRYKCLHDGKHYTKTGNISLIK